jgi:hypothetical protein
VIKGGNKSNGKNAGHSRSSSGNLIKRMSTGAIQEWKNNRATNINRSGSWSQMPAANVPMGRGKNAARATDLPDFDPNMELDFDGIDFQGIDIGLAGMGMDDITMTQGEDLNSLTALTTGDSMQGIPAMSTGVGMSALTAALTSAGDMNGMYAPISTDSGDIFGNNNAMNLDFSGLDGGIQQHQGMNEMQLQGQEPFLTEEEMNSLAGFDSTF